MHDFSQDLRHTLVVFDLDGTLIDSSFQIAQAASAALAGRALISPSEVGPPLVQMLAKALGCALDDPQVSQAHRAFCALYDDRAALAPVYPGVLDMLLELSRRGARLALATNKRRAPTLRIAVHHGWDKLFSAGLFAFEDFELSTDGLTAWKASALERAARTHPGYNLSMVGDSEGDFDAASTAGYHCFHFALWGALGSWRPSLSLGMDGTLHVTEHAEPRTLVPDLVALIRRRGLEVPPTSAVHDAM